MKKVLLRTRLGYFLAGAIWLLLIEGVFAMWQIGALAADPPLAWLSIVCALVVLVVVWKWRKHLVGCQR